MGASIHPGSIVILDCGGQYAHLIGSRVRRFGAFSEICDAETPAHELKDAAGIILSGGPQSVYEAGSPQADPAIFNLGIPVLGICYGHQLIAHLLGGTVAPGKTKEYGRAKIRNEKGEVSNAKLFAGCPEEFVVWMSHGDSVTEVPQGFQVIASSDDCPVAAMADPARNIFGVQFHLEVTHTEHGLDILQNFISLCTPAPWSIESYAQSIGDAVRTEVGDRNVFLLVSGGVDSSVAFVLLNKVLGSDRVQGLMVDTGLMRKGETALIREAFAALGIQNLRIEDASDEFFTALEGAYEPEEKRRIIGDTFLDVAGRVMVDMGIGSWLANRSSDLGASAAPLRQGFGGQPSPSEGWMLGQGTIYPDTIETGATKHADKIKTHHNRVEAIERMIEQGLVIEPLKELYKDEVRALGEEIGLPHDLVWRHPFPGPGLGVRILCASPTPGPSPGGGGGTIELLRDVAHVTLPIRSVGVQGDGRSYRHAVVLFHDEPTQVTEQHLVLATSVPNATAAYNRVLLCVSHREPQMFHVTSLGITRGRADLLREADAIVDEEVRRGDLYGAIWQFPVVLIPVGTTPGGQTIVLRPISSTDAMTANAFVLPPAVLQRMTKRIVALPGIDAVLLDLTNKPPATIEWE